MNGDRRAKLSLDITDIEYLRHADVPLLARVYRPRGSGPFPLLIDVHGGGWCRKNRMADVGADQPLAESGVVVAALDFRMPPTAGYPDSLADINYAIRWFKAHASQFGSRAGLTGIIGFSSGGHQAMLAAMRPHDTRYAQITTPAVHHTSATLSYAVLCWPVVDPLGRYQYARRLERSRSPDPKRPRHDAYLPYWPSVAAMAEGNPALALERGEPLHLPEVLCVQGSADDAHPRENLERFAASYKRAGGAIDVHWFEGMRQSFITKDPSTPASQRALALIIEFVHRQAKRLLKVPADTHDEQADLRRSAGVRD